MLIIIQIRDAYPKIITARTKHDHYQYKGIQIYDIAKWLAEEFIDFDSH